ADIHSGVSEERPNRLIRHARPVADAPVEALAARGEELARSWAIALVAARPLTDMAAVPLEELARYAPSLCASLVRALSSEQELASLAAATDGASDPNGRPQGAALGGLQALASGWGDADAVEHIEALRGVIWKAALQELRDPSAGQVAELADRLSSICATVLAGALARVDRSMPADAPSGRRLAPREQVLFSAPGLSPGAPGAVLIDELDESPRPIASRAPLHDERAHTAAGVAAGGPTRERSPTSAGAAGSEPPTAPRPLPWDTPLRTSSQPGRVVDAGASDGPGDAPVLRVSRGPGTPLDRRV